MMIVSDSDVGLTSGFHGRTQHGRAVTGRGTASADPRRRCFSVVPRFLSSPLWQPLCCLYVPPLSPHDREYAVAVTLSPRELPDLLPPSLLGRLRCGTPAVGV